MRSLRKFIGLAVFMMAGSLFAQPADQAKPADRAFAPETQESLNAAQMIERVKLLGDQAASDNRLVQALQISARKEKDVVKLTCVNDKLLQIKALRNALARAALPFDGSDDVPAMEAGFAEVRDTSTEIRQLREQAQLCGGEPELSGESSTAGWDGPDLPDNPNDQLFPEGVEPPGYASPFN